MLAHDLLFPRLNILFLKTLPEMTQFPHCHDRASGSPLGHHVLSDVGLPRQFLNLLHLFPLLHGTVTGLFQ